MKDIPNGPMVVQINCITKFINNALPRPKPECKSGGNNQQRREKAMAPHSSTLA